MLMICSEYQNCKNAVFLLLLWDKHEVSIENRDEDITEIS